MSKSSFNNIFPHIYQPISHPSIITQPTHQTLVQYNKNKLKTIQAQYFQNEYKKLQQIKNQIKQKQKQQKQKDKQLIKHKHQIYQIQLEKQKQKVLMEKEYLSNDYAHTINYKQSKNKYQKQLSKNIEKQSFNTPTWLRDANIQRQNQIKKKFYYNKILEDHIKIQQQRKKQNKQSQQKQKQKIQKQIDQMLKKQMYYMQARHRQKSLFEQRQNQILGLNSQQPNLQQSRAINQKQRNLKIVQRQLYRQGLHAQYQKQKNLKESKRNSLSQEKQDFTPRYNPITNPIPFVYKNPNVLRMLNQ